jgi:hypothetical protein
MQEQVLIGKDREIIAISRNVWEQGLRGRVPLIKARLEFMSESHHLVRNFVAKELPKTRKPLSPEFISENLDLPKTQVISILEDLEKHLTFLYRNNQGEVTWAYPVTVEGTPHKIVFSTGERINAA